MSSPSLLDAVTQVATAFDRDFSAETGPDTFRACHDREGIFLDVSTNCADLLGYRAEELIGRSAYDWFHPEDLTKIQVSHTTVLDRATSYTVTYRFRHKQGHYVCLSTTSRTVWIDDRARVAGILSESRLSDRCDTMQWHVQNARALVNESLLSQIINSLNDPVFVKDEQHRWVYFNDAFCRFLGRERSELLGKSDYDLLPRAEADRFCAVDDRVFATGLNDETEETIADATGNVRTLLTKKALMQVPEGKFLVAIIRDISDRVEREQKLTETRDRLRVALEATQTGLWEWDINADRFSGNTQIQALLGVPSHHQTLDLWQSRIHPEDLPEFRTSIQSHLTESVHPCRVEYRLQTQSGEWRWFSDTNRAIVDIDGQPVRIVGIATDITDRKQAEAELVQSEAQIRALFEAIPDLIFHISHDGIYLDVKLSVDVETLLSPDAFLGKHITETLPDKVANAILAAIDRTLKTRTTQFLEYDLPFGDEIRSYEARMVALNEDEVLALVQDISQRKQAEQTRQFQAQIIDRIHDAIVATDLHGKITYWNRGAQRMFGILKSEAIGRSIDFSYASDRSDFLQQYIMEPLLEKGSHELEVLLQRQSGETFDGFLSLSLFYDNQGEATGAIGYIMDISDRKQAERQLRESEKRYQLLSEASPIGVYYTDVRGDCRYVNRAWLEIAGMSLEQTFGQGWSRALHPEDRESIFAEWYRTAARGQPFRTECRFKRPDDLDVWVISQAIPAMNEEGEIEGYVGTITDISDRKQAEERVRELLLRARLVNEIEAEIRRSLNLDTVVQTTVSALAIQLNLDLCLFARYRSDLDCPVWEATHEYKTSQMPSCLGNYENEWFPMLFDTFLSGNLYRVDSRDRCTDPAFAEFLERIGVTAYLGVPVQAQDRDIVGVLVMARRHTDRPWDDGEIELLQQVSVPVAIAIDQAELYHAATSKTQELERAYSDLQKAQTRLIQVEKMSSIGQLVAGVAHEINNPISFIYGNLQYATDYARDILELIGLYRKHYPDPHPEIDEFSDRIELDYLTEDFTQLLQSMKTGATRIRDIIQSLRTFSRLDEAEFKEIDLHDNLESTLVILQNRLSGRDGNPEIEIVKQYGNLPRVECHAGLLNQVFMNLFVNAIDAIDEYRSRLDTTARQRYRGCITIATSRLEGDRVSITIGDNGCGMSESVQAKIFNPFFTTKPIGRGTGMGLATSYQIVTDNHGGELHCVSKLGEGTTFILEIPSHRR